MNELFWFPLHSGDFLSKTALLSCEASGAYVLLLVHLCRHNRIAAKPKQIAQLCKGCKPASIKAALVLLSKDEQGYFCPELEKQKAKLALQSMKKSLAGKLGASARWGKDEQEFRQLQQNHNHNLKDKR